MTHFENQRATHQMNTLRLARVSIEFLFFCRNELVRMVVWLIKLSCAKQPTKLK